MTSTATIAAAPSSSSGPGPGSGPSLLSNTPDFLELFVSKGRGGGGGIQQQRLKEFLQKFVQLQANGAKWDEDSQSSLLVQQLLSHFGDAFLTTSKSHDQIFGELGGDRKFSKSSSLRDFLCDEVTLLLLISIHLISKQIDATFPELAELLLVVIKTLLSKSSDFEMDRNSVMNLVPFYNLIEGDSHLILSAFENVLPFALPPEVDKTHHSKPPSDDKVSDPSTKNSPESRPRSNHMTSAPIKPFPPIVPASEINQLIESILEQKPGPRDVQVTDRELHMLLFSVLESISSPTSSTSWGTSKVSSTIHLLQNVATLFEEVMGVWLQLHSKEGGVGSQMKKKAKDAHQESENEILTYSGSLHLARITLRLWMNLSSQVLHSSLQEQHLPEIQSLLYAPLEMVSKACYNLQQGEIFKGNSSLDHEFTLIILEGLFSALYIVNMYPRVPLCELSNFYEALCDTLTDSCQEWLAYLCSKLHGVSGGAGEPVGRAGTSEGGNLDQSNGEEVMKEDIQVNSKEERVLTIPSNWIEMLNYSYTLLTFILTELLTTSSHIKICQQASKMALVASGSDGKTPIIHSPFQRPITYSLEVATGFDKLTFRLSKMAELLLSMFKEVPRVQLLSLQLLSETTKDTVGVIGSFLLSISDLTVSSKPEILDPYLEQLEEIWFRLSADYGRSATPWWKKLASYSHLLMNPDHRVVCQVLYHIQCLFSHESSTLKSQLTKRVVIPFHAHLMAMVKTKCFKATTIVTSEREKNSRKSKGSKSTSTTKVTQVVQTGHEMDLDDNEREILSLFLKLLAKVVSHPRSLGTFASNGTNLYSLFLLLPLDGFRMAGLRVLEECLSTIHKFGSTTCVSPGSSTASSPVMPGGKLSPALSSPPTVEVTRPDETGIQVTLIQILLSVAYSMKMEKIPDQCLSIAEGHASLLKYGLAEADEVHKLIVNTFEHKTITQLLTKGVIRHISVMADVWDLLAWLATNNVSAAEILRENHIWDVTQVFGPSLANVLSRLHQRLSRDNKDLSEFEVAIGSLRECGVSLLSHLQVLAHYLCWQKRDLRSLEVYCNEVQNALSLDKGTRILSFNHSHLYITAMLKASCCFSHVIPPLSSSSSSSATPSGTDSTQLERPHPQALPIIEATTSSSSSAYALPPIYSSTPTSLKDSHSSTTRSSNINIPTLNPTLTSNHPPSSLGATRYLSMPNSSHHFSPKTTYPRTKRIPIIGSGRSLPQRYRSSMTREYFSNSGSFTTSPLTAGGGNLPLRISTSTFSPPPRSRSSGNPSPMSSWSVWTSSCLEAELAPDSFQSWVWVNGTESESSGYEADVERDVQSGLEQGESCTEEGGRTGGLNHLPVSPYPIPNEVQQRIWTTIPLTHCIRLLEETLKGKITKNCEKSVEVFLVQFLSMLKADGYNSNLLSGKGYLGALLDAFESLFKIRTEGCIACCQLICHVAELMAVCQISPSETRKLFMRLQTSKTHLEKLPPLLFNISHVSSVCHPEPSTYVEFSYNRPSNVISFQQMLMVPYTMPWNDRPRCFSLWFCVDKYPLQAQIHIFSAFTGRSYFQIWVCACSGDVTLRLSSSMLLSFPEKSQGSSCSTVTLGSIVQVGCWHHMTANLLPVPSQSLYEVLVVMDGTDKFCCPLKLPASLPNSSPSPLNQYFFAGGGVNPRISEKHIALIGAENNKISWKLSSLSILNGFGRQNMSVSTVLHHLGPDCASSNRQAVSAILQRCRFSYSEDHAEDTSYIRSSPLDESDQRSLLGTPILSYSANDPHQVFVTSYKEDQEVNRDFQLQWVLSATIVVKPRLLDNINSVIGIDQLVYLYAKVVSEECSEEIQCYCLSLLHLATEHSITAYLEFEQHGGMSLIQKVMRTPLASVGERTLKAILNWCCDSELKQVKVVPVLNHILLDWRIWHKAPQGVWEKLLCHLEQLLVTPSNGIVSQSSVNWHSFLESNAIGKLLLTSKERSLENLPPLPPSIACMFIRLITCLLGEPLDMNHLILVCNHLLVSDINEVKYVLPPGKMEASVSAYDGRRPSVPIATSISQLVRESVGSETGSVTSPVPSSQSTVMVLSDSTHLSEDEAEEIITFDTQPNEGRLPNSSYSAADTLFTWADITGQLQDAHLSEEIPTSIEVGLLGHLRKQMSLMSDADAKHVVGQVLHHEMLIAITHNKNIVIRTAVIRVLDEYFKRGGEGVRSNFVQVKGFHLLASQLKPFKMSFELMSALCSIVVGKDISLKRDQLPYIVIPKSLNLFCTHAVVPVLQCVVNTISQPELFHSTFCMLRELFEVVKGMPAFMLHNGLLKVICQVISIAADHPRLSIEDKERILNDIHQMCKLVIIFAISADQEELFNMLENLLVCLRHCYEELRKYKGPDALSVLYLHLFQYLILTQALHYFHEDAEDGGGSLTGSGERSRASYIPTLASSTQPPGHADLTSRFVIVCNMAVDWVACGVDPYSSEHAQYLLDDEVTLPSSISLEAAADKTRMDVAFLRYLFHFFHKTIHPVLKKQGGTLSSVLDRQRYSMSARAQLNEQLGRLLGHMISSIHDNAMRCAVMKELWNLEDARLLLHYILTSSLKKLLAPRLILTMVQLMMLGSSDIDLMTILNEIYEVAVRSGVTKLRNTTRLASLMAYEDERDPRKRQKYEIIMEEIRSSDQRWQERASLDVRAFSQKLKDLYSRLVEKTNARQLAIDRTSSIVTEHIFHQQSLLKQNCLDQIFLAGRHERDSLRCWRKLILHNTHPRALWSSDERRLMCWQLDPTEGPGRVRRRMIRVPRTVDDKHFLPEAEKSSDNDCSPLSFIFEHTAYNAMEGLMKKIITQNGEVIMNNNMPWSCLNISPDSCCKGDLVMSTRCCYFVGNEPLDDPNITKLLPCDEETTLLSWEHSEVVEIHRRRYMLKNNALEIFLISGKTLLLAFDTTKDRTAVHQCLLGLELPNLVDSGEADSEKLRHVSTSWKQGEITNFEYLMELNKLAGRTFNDLMQYPVFPFILANYKHEKLDFKIIESFRKLELPISIQDENKRHKYIETYKFLEAEVSTSSSTPGLPNHASKPYHYGSHYSNSGIVLHFLVRLPPFTGMFLAFQGQNFDIADRTFRNMDTTWWLSSSESATDVKELIPEFFFLPEFLKNTERYNFGECQDGSKVDHVKLPPWAGGDARLFILKHRQALESDFVSQNLHNWIDLVFGYKQTGKAAVQAINVFHPATYYGGMDIDSVTDVTQQAAMRTMVKTYGQMPAQLFKEPHPPRTKTAPVLTNFRMRLGNVLKRLTAISPLVKITNPLFWMRVSLHKARISTSNQDCDFIGLQGTPDLIYAHRAGHERIPENMVSIGNREVIITGRKAHFVQNASPAHSSLLMLWDTWDNSLVLVSTIHEMTIHLHSHPFNKITCAECVKNGQMIVSGGNGGVVSFWSIQNTVQSLQYSGEVTHLRGHSGPITCMAACKPFSIVVTGSSDKTAIIWDTNRLCYVNSLTDHENPVSVIATSPTLGDIATVCTSRAQKHSKGAATSTLQVWTINGSLVGRIIVEEEIHCLAYSTAPEGTYVNVLAGGLANGNIKLWSSWDLSLVREIECPLQNPIPVLSLTISSCSKELYAGFSDRQIVTWVKPKQDFSSEEVEFEHIKLENYMHGRIS